MQFSFSETQKKDLLVRGQPLLIAIPLDRQTDIQTDSEALQHAKKTLIFPDGVRVKSATVDEVAISTPQAHTWPPERLTNWLGDIVIEGKLQETRAFLISVHVVVLALVCGPEERHPFRSPQWPNGILRLPEIP